MSFFIFVRQLTKMNLRQVYILIGILLISFTFSCSKSKKAKAQNLKDEMSETVKGPVMTFDKTMVDFGEVKKGEKRTTTYSFVNTGDEALVIEIATTCHCTELVYPRNIPIAPGEGGKFDITFDSSEKEKSEKVDITIVLVNTDKNGYPMIEELFFKFDLVQ